MIVIVIRVDIGIAATVVVPFSTPKSRTPITSPRMCVTHASHSSGEKNRGVVDGAVVVGLSIIADWLVD